MYVPTPENLQARKEFQDNKFGIFLHWGIYSMFGQGEWYMNNDNIDCHEYAKVASGFYPSRFDAHEWVAAIKASGARYICITSRHHDGFPCFIQNIRITTWWMRHLSNGMLLRNWLKSVRSRASSCIYIIPIWIGHERTTILWEERDTELAVLRTGNGLLSMSS